ncbi:DoxX family protein [Bacillus sp. DTU_2020_1000418_1_SI_GHA_SEK_038]|uniref:DoxX family protein n=1 Tax=Bacillus sp. DTU_2020_1000418_1_SI_GHA_SEK_038 TaxID=3077585 RepID=UPI0028E996E7|nr:DoxX family protein [Bacillus sp. DTU_2020_1000418_1_SI_GHA_SEK_038]WNS76593.1 DoxX family protein [Bacillus sp. DTU_2020_1000418_1_SI_GHA_SEK_038]
MAIKISISTDQLIRYAVAYVFIIAGLIKFINPEMGTYFVNLGLPYPISVMYIVAIVELICGVLILLNRSVANATLPLIGIMIVAIILTKIPTLHAGFFQFAANARLDIVMLILLFILYNHHPAKRY